VVKGEDSQVSGCGFKSRRRILDGVTKLAIRLKRNKGSRMGHTKTYLKKQKTAVCHLKKER
jgi:hypothetical protein